MNRSRGRPPAIEPAEVDYHITIVDGVAGKRLATVQAQAILKVLLWWRDHTRATPGDQDGGAQP